MWSVSKIRSLLNLRPHSLSLYRYCSQNCLSERLFERICNETLNSLYEYIDSLAETDDRSFDIAFSNGVLSANFGTTFGSFVINRQLPNKQIWLSSPFSGPARFDLHIQNNEQSTTNTKYIWIYKQNGQSLHRLLQAEFQIIFPTVSVDFLQCMHSN